MIFVRFPLNKTAKILYSFHCLNLSLEGFYMFPIVVLSAWACLGDDSWFLVTFEAIFCSNNIWNSFLIIVGIWFYFKPFSTIIILVDLMTIQKWTQSIQRPNDFDVSKNQLAAHYCYWYSSTTMVRSPLMYHLISKWPRDLLHKWNEIISKYLGIL